jgi:transposase-like protein
MSVLSRPYFHDEEAAFQHLENLLWPDGPVCPHCGGMDRISKIKANPSKRVRYGLHKCGNCGNCGKQFTVKVGTVFEHGRIPLQKFLQAVHLMACSKKGISAHQLHRILEVQYRTAWFLAHRIREAMRDGSLGPLGGQNKVIEADESFVGGKAKNRAYAPPPKKVAVFSLVERQGKVSSRRVADVSAATLGEAIEKIADRQSHLMTDDAPTYAGIGKEFAGHSTVNHSANEYVRLGGFVHTNTAENYFSILKRGVIGTFHHVSERYLPRYLAEFDFRYNRRSALGVEDEERAGQALAGMKGKRLTYR